MIRSKCESLWDYKDHFIVLIESDWKFSLHVIVDYKYQLMLISNRHAQLQLTNTKLVALDCPAGVQQIDVSAETGLHVWEKQAVVIIH